MKLKNINIVLALLLLPFGLIAQNSISSPEISISSGFYTEDFTVSITHPDSEVTLLYTLDGSSPKMENLSGNEWEFKRVYPANPGDTYGAMLKDTAWTYQFGSPIAIQNRSAEMDRYSNISTSVVQNQDFYNNYGFFVNKSYKSTVLRAVAYKNGAYSEVVTRNYFVDVSGNHYTVPVVCLSVEPEDLFGFEEGFYVPGKVFDEWRIDNPQEPLGIWTPGNFRVSGAESEKTINFSYFVENEEVINQTSGLRLHGHGNRAYVNRSLRLYARNDYGDNKFRYNFFENLETDKFKRLILRNSGSDTEWTMFRDVFVHDVSRKLNVTLQEYQPTVLMINGEYFGIYNLRERIDRKYFKQNFGVEENELDFIKRLEVKDGDDLAFNGLLDYVNNHDLSIQEEFDTVVKWVDDVNFSDYNIAGIFMGNIDWPDNNNNKWRKRVLYDTTAPYGQDGRWRWLITDFDFSLGEGGILSPNTEGVNYNHLGRVTIPSGSNFDNYTILIRGMLKNEGFKNYFINRFCDIMNSSYKPNFLMSRLNHIAALYEPEMEEFTHRWNPQSYPGLITFPVPAKPAWEDLVGDMATFIDQRPYWIKQHIAARFAAGEVKEVIVDVSGIEHGNVQINTLKIDENTDGLDDVSVVYPWQGDYFENVPIRLKAIAKPGYQFSHWSGIVNDTLPEITLNLEDTVFIKANFVPAADLGVKEQKIQKDFKVYPNPFNDEITILLESYVNVKFRLFSNEGKQLLSGQLNQPILKLNGIKDGVYFLEIDMNGEVMSTKIVK